MTDTATPWTVEQLTAILPPDAKTEERAWTFHADWTTAGHPWTLTASWHTHRPTHVAIYGPHASTTLTGPTIEAIEAFLLLHGALSETKPVTCPHPGCLVSTDFVESMDHHLAEHDEAVAAWRADTAEGETER